MSLPPKRTSRRDRSPTNVLTQRPPSQQRPKPRRRSVWVLLALLLLWSLCLGIGLAQATEPKSTQHQALQPKSAPTLAQSSQPPAQVTYTPVGTVDIVPERYKAGEQLYLETCATCHIGLPPAVMPTETWRQLLQDSEHYGATLKPLVSPELQITWQYIRDFSRPHDAGEEIPYRVYQSKFFKALHPRVKFSDRVTLNSCASCHPGADKYDFRSLSAEWQNAP